MKYQIYLNKETSDFINYVSEQEEIKSATLIKRLVEDMVSITLATKKETEKALQRGLKGDK